MAKNGFKLVDAEMHVMEPVDLWDRYIDPEFKDRAPVGLERRPFDIGVQVEERILSRSRSYNKTRVAADTANQEWDAERYGFARERGWDATSQIQAMDVEGVDVAVIYPSRGLFVLGLDTKERGGILEGIDSDFALAIARAYNDWLHDFCRQYPDRLFGAAMVPPHDVDMAVAETRRCVEQYGFKSVFMLPSIVGHRHWHYPYFDPLWAECQRLNIPVGFHGGAIDYLTPDLWFGIFDWWMMGHTFSHPLGPMFALVSMTAGGVFDRFPELRVGYLEANCGWAPWLLGRLDDHYEWRGYIENPDLKMKPSEYFKRNCYVSVEADERAAKLYVDWFGDDNVVFSTDYPHSDSKYPRAVDTLLEELPVSEETKRKFLWDNCARLYNLGT
jgi:predicted TIM-barrel fold metal-dependent hydrolase